jgi:transposase
MHYIGLDVHKKTISYCVKDGSGAIHAEGTIPATRFDLDRWMKTLPQPWTAAMEATVFTGWIYDHLHPAALKVAQPLMLRAIAAAKKKNDRIDAKKICDCLRCDFLPGATWPQRRFANGGARCGIATCWFGRWCR